MSSLHFAGSNGGMGFTLRRVLDLLPPRGRVAVAELNPVVVRLTDEGHLRDPEFHLAAFRWRAEHLLSTLARRLKKRLDAGVDPFDALVAVQDHAVATARCRSELLTLESFRRAINEVEGEELASILDRLAMLFALWRVELDRGWFQEHGYLESGKAKAIRKQVVALCREIRPQALHLVDSFAIPDPLLAAPIAVENV